MPGVRMTALVQAEFDQPASRLTHLNRDRLNLTTRWRVVFMTVKLGVISSFASEFVSDRRDVRGETAGHFKLKSSSTRGKS